jgi:hypothetical protein
MDLRKEILKDHSRSQTNKIVKYIGKDPAKLKKLVEVFLQGPFRITQRAAWPLSISAESHPELILPHLKPIMDHLKKPGIHDAVKRNTMRLLQFIEIPKRFHPQVIDLCFTYLQDLKEPVAVRVFSMTVLSRIIKYHPELGKELKIIIEDNLPYASAAFISRAKKVLKEIHAI